MEKNKEKEKHKPLYLLTAGTQDRSGLNLERGMSAGEGRNFVLDVKLKFGFGLDWAGLLNL